MGEVAVGGPAEPGQGDPVGAGHGQEGDAELGRGQGKLFQELLEERLDKRDTGRGDEGSEQA